MESQNHPYIVYTMLPQPYLASPCPQSFFPKICAMKLTRSSKIFGEDLTSPEHIISPLYSLAQYMIPQTPWWSWPWPYDHDIQKHVTPCQALWD